jgi:hypothetical protein
MAQSLNAMHAKVRIHQLPPQRARQLLAATTADVLHALRCASTTNAAAAAPGPHARARALPAAARSSSTTNPLSAPCEARCSRGVCSTSSTSSPVPRHSLQRRQHPMTTASAASAAAGGAADAGRPALRLLDLLRSTLLLALATPAARRAAAFADAQFLPLCLAAAIAAAVAHPAAGVAVAAAFDVSGAVTAALFVIAGLQIREEEVKTAMDAKGEFHGLTAQGPLPRAAAAGRAVSRADGG